MGYMLLERLAQILPLGEGSSSTKVIGPATPKLVRLLAVVLPILAALSLLLVHHFACFYLRSEQALGVAIAYALTPSFALVQLHFDQAVYPLLCLGMWLLVLRAGRTWVEGLLLGVLIYLSVFVSFSLLPAVLLVPLLLWTDHRRPQLAWGSGVLTGGIGMLCLGVWAGYLPWVRYSAAMAHHSTWKLDLGSVAGGAVFAAQCGRVALVARLTTGGPCADRGESHINDGFNSDPATGMVFVARSCLVACPWTDHW